MISTVSLNPSLDFTMHLPRLALRENNWAERVDADLGGKGINCARMLQVLGSKTQIIAVLGGDTGEYLRHTLQHEGLECKYVESQQNTRIGLLIKDSISGPETTLMERGVPVSHSETVDIMEMVKQVAIESKFVVFSGNVPPGMNSSIYRALIQICNSKGCKAVLDSSGQELAEGINAAPFMIAPNKAEAERLLGLTLSSLNDVALGALSIARMGIPLPVISLGSQGAVAAYEESVYSVTSPVVKRASSIGSGDSFVAGIVHGIASGMDIVESLSLGAAAGAATALIPGSDVGTSADVERLRAQVKVVKSN